METSFLGVGGSTGEVRGGAFFPTGIGELVVVLEEQAIGGLLIDIIKGVLDAIFGIDEFVFETVLAPNVSKQLKIWTKF